jgi:hypothetical protein
MIPRRISVLILLTLSVLFTSLAGAEKLPGHFALQAQQMLSGQARWAEAIQIENTNRSSRYPRTVYATVFEFEDSLWFYTSSGTQPIVASKHKTEQFKGNLLPLLRTIDRGFTSFARMQPLQESLAEYPQLPNGCVVESIYTLGGVKQQGTPVLTAKLLLYSSTKNTRRGANGNATGHCVLVYQTPYGMFFVDPPELGVTGTIQLMDWDPVKMAREIESAYGNITIEEAFFVPFNLPVLASSS